MSAPLRNRRARPPAPGPQGPIPPVSNMDLGGLRRYASTVGMEHPQQWAGRPTPWGLTDAERTANVLRQQSSADRPLEADPVGEFILTAGVQSAPSLARALGRRIVRPAAAPAPAPRPAPAVDDDLPPLASMDNKAGQQAMDDIWWRDNIADVRAEQTALPLRPGVKPPGEEGLDPLPPLIGGDSLPPLPPPLPAVQRGSGSMPTRVDVPSPAAPTGNRGLAEEWMLPGWQAKYGKPNPELVEDFEAASARRRYLMSLAERAGVDTRGALPWRGQFMRTPAGRSAPTEFPEPTEADFALANIKAGVAPGAPAPAPPAPVAPVPQMMKTAVGRRR